LCDLITARADLNGILAALGAHSVDEALDKIEQLIELDGLLDWLSKADVELQRNWDEWRVGYGDYPMRGTHYQNQDDDWKITKYYNDARTALLTAFRKSRKNYEPPTPAQKE